MLLLMHVLTNLEIPRDLELRRVELEGCDPGGRDISRTGVASVPLRDVVLGEAGMSDELSRSCQKSGVDNSRIRVVHQRPKFLFVISTMHARILCVLPGLHVCLLLLLRLAWLSHLLRTRVRMLRLRLDVGKGLLACTRNSRGSGGLLPVCKAISYNMDGRQSPTCRKRVKGGVSGPEDMRPVSEVEAGVNFRPAGIARGQVGEDSPERRPGPGSRKAREVAVTPSLHPEVPGTQYAPPGRGLGIRQSMGWTKACETARSGTWVLKGDARTRMLPANLDHLRLGWRPRETYETAWVTPGHDCLCPHEYGHGADHKLKTPSVMGLLVCGAESHPSCHLGVQGGMCQRE